MSCRLSNNDRKENLFMIKVLYPEVVLQLVDYKEALKEMNLIEDCGWMCMLSWDL